MPKSIRKLFVLSCFAALLVCVISIGTASAARFAWDTSTDADGYIIHYGTSESDQSQSVDVGKVSSYDLDNFSLPENVWYYFSLSAYNAAGESPRTHTERYRKEPSTQVDTTPPNAPTGLTATIPTN